MRGKARAGAAGTVINAIATFRGSAFGIELWMWAEVELGGDFRGVSSEIFVGGEREGGGTLVERCVRLVLEACGERGLGGFVRTESEIPMASGLKSSSAAANAATLATLDALGVRVSWDVPERVPSPFEGRTPPRLEDEIHPLDAVRIGVRAALEAGVSITGAFDDACASMLGGFVVTDNRETRLLRRVERDAEVLVLVPEGRAFTADADVGRMRLLAPYVDVAFDLALRGEFERAMTLNGFLYCAALRFSPEPMMKALGCGVRGVSLSGTGPSYVAIVPDADASKALREVWGRIERSRIIETKVNNTFVFES
ncbi:MAG: shikimate kinase [Candidatus Alkanophagales archaeon]